VDEREGDASPVTLVATIAAALARADDQDAALGGIVDAATLALGVDVVTVFVQDAERAELQLAAAHGLPESVVGPFAAAVTSGQHPIANVARSREAVWGRRSEPQAGSLVGADLPLTVRRGGVDLPIGVVSFGWPDGHEITSTERTLASAFADLLAVAVDHGRLTSLVTERSEWLERMAHSDPLTGLANARTFDRVLELEVARAARQSSELSVAIFDVDDFAGLNAAAGHAAGDDVLRAIASVLAESVRLVDTVARYGGDEFVVVAPGTAGTTLARRVLDGVAALPRVDGRQISVSAGVAHLPRDGASSEDLLAAANDALTRAKSGGNGRLEPSGAETPA
jgi:diguanylate cyclase (GGDEF)-like protein